MITIERLKQIATSGHWDSATTQEDIRDLAKFLVEQAERQEAMKPRPRAERGQIYYYVDEYFSVMKDCEQESGWNKGHYKSGNYFLTEEEAQAFADKIKELRKTMKICH